LEEVARRPVAQAAPEAEVNNVLWDRRGKDTLALGNITGAMVFHPLPLAAFGMVFTHWQLNGLRAAGGRPRRGAMAGISRGHHHRPVAERRGCWHRSSRA